jgi:hypothetical protein
MKTSFKVVSLMYMALIVPLTLFLLSSLILALAKVIIINNTHFVIFIVAISISMCYVVYLLISLLLDKFVARK